MRTHSGAFRQPLSLGHCGVAESSRGNRQVDVGTEEIRADGFERIVAFAIADDPAVIAERRRWMSSRLLARAPPGGSPLGVVLAQPLR